MLVSATHFYAGLVSNLSSVFITNLFIVFHAEVTFSNKQWSQEAYMDEQEVSGKTQMEKGSLQNLEKKTSHMGGIHKHCQSRQGFNKEG